MKKFTSIILFFTTILALNQSDAVAQWKKKSDNLQFNPGRWGAMSFVLNSKVYITGGYVNNKWENDVQMYDPAADKWVFKNAPCTPGGPANRSAGIAFVVGSKAYLGLGAQNFIAINGTQQNLRDIWEYDGATDKWTQKASIPDSGRTEASVFVINNKAYIVGGALKGDQTWEYDPAANKWTKKADFPYTVTNAHAFAINGKGYVTGGLVASGKATAKTYEYDPAANTWTAKADYIDTARYGGVSFVVDGKGYIGLGGTGQLGSSNYLTSFYSYDPATDKWKYVFAKWPVTPRLFGTGVVIGGKAYVGNGWRLDGSTQTFFRDWYEADITAALGIDAQTVVNDLQVYPNPTNGMVTVQLPNQAKTYSYTLTSTMGQVVASGVVPSTGKLNFGQVTAGQYILQLINDTEVAKTKILIHQ